MSRPQKNCVNHDRFAQLMADQVDLIVAAQPAGVETSEPLESQAVPGLADAIVFPGAFNPLHDAHLAMANLACRRLQRPVWFEISVENVDKPVLDFIEIANRTRQAHHPHGMLLTRTPTFELKSHLFAGCVFIVGLDTIARINEPRYYNNDIAEMARSIRTIAENGCRFLVFARKQYNISTIGSNFKVGGSLDSQLDELCEFVPADEFCMELSSTDIRDRQRN